MVPALFLWISLSFILDSSFGFAVDQGGSFRLTPPSQNLEVDQDFTLTDDEGEGQSMDNKLSGSVYSNFNALQKESTPYLDLAGQNVPNTIWQLSAQYPAVDSTPQGFPSSNAIVWSVETNNMEMPAYQYPPEHEESSSDSFVQGNDIWQPSIQYSVVNAKPAGSAAVWSIKGNEVGQPTTQYPPVNAKPAELLFNSNDVTSSTTYDSPSKPSLKHLVRDWPSSRKWMDFVFSNSFDDDDLDFQPQNFATVDRSWFPVLAEEQHTLPQSPKSFIVRSKNGYKRGRVVHTKTFYSTDYEKPKMAPAKAAAQNVEDNAKTLLP